MPEVSRRETLFAAGLLGVANMLPARAQQADVAAWDLRDLYPDSAAWEGARRAIEGALPGLARFKGRLGESADLLAEALVLQSDLERALSRLFVYATLKADEDLRVAAN